jgi:hypothetical protein
MDIRMTNAKSATKKWPGFLGRAFKPVADVSEQSQVDHHLREQAKHHKAASLFAPTFKSWNR